MTSSISAASSSTSMWKAPQSIVDFYAKFPLVLLEQENHPSWSSPKGKGKESCILWIDPPSPGSINISTQREWCSSTPTSLRTQLLFLLRPGPSVTFKSWSNAASAPGGTLPALHLPEENRLIGSNEIRGWLDERYPLGTGKSAELVGMKDQVAYDQALALAQLVLGNLYPAYLASLSTVPPTLPLLFPTPPPLSAGLSTPLPASITGDSRHLDIPNIIRKGVEALDTFDILIEGQGWALGSKEPTPLDALIVAYLNCLYFLDTDKALVTKLKECDGLGRYVQRVLDKAETRLQS